MRIRTFLASLAILFLAVSLPLAAQSASCLPQARESAFQVGEEMNLSLIYKWGAVNTEVASANMALESTRYKGEEVYHTRLKVRSATFFDVFFKMREDFQSWFAMRDLKPRKFIRDTYEGGYTALNQYIYDWKAGVIHADVNFENRGAQSLDIPLHDCVYDLPALIYYLRNADFSRMKAGKSYPLSFAIDDAVFNVKLNYKGVETIKVRRLGKIRARHFSCSVVQGAMFKGDQELQIWVSDDANCLPLAVMVPLRIGSVWAYLKSYDHIKYPFSARL